MLEVDNMEGKRCYSCGSDKELVKVKNAIAKRGGYDVSIKEGYACKNCLKEKKIIT